MASAELHGKHLPRRATARRTPRGGRGLAVGAVILGGIGVAAVAYTTARGDAAHLPAPSPSPSAGAGWIDDFDGEAGALADPRWWQYQLGDGGWGNEEWQTYTTENAVLDGESHLVITARIDPDAPPGEQYTSARLVSIGSYTEGLLEARIKLPAEQGLLPAFWLLGADLEQVGYPASGEIDVVEVPHEPTHTAHSLHALDPNDPSPTSHGQVTVDVEHEVPVDEDFHVYGVERTLDSVTLLFDGEVVAEFTRDSVADRVEWAFDKPFRALLSLAIGGVWVGEPDETTPVESQMVVDWIRLTEPE